MVAEMSLAKGTNEINLGVGDTTFSSVKEVKDQRRHDLKRRKKANYCVSDTWKLRSLRTVHRIH